MGAKIRRTNKINYTIAKYGETLYGNYTALFIYISSLLLELHVERTRSNNVSHRAKMTPCSHPFIYSYILVYIMYGGKRGMQGSL